MSTLELTPSQKAAQALDSWKEAYIDANDIRLIIKSTMGLDEVVQFNKLIDKEYDTAVEAAVGDWLRFIGSNLRVKIIKCNIEESQFTFAVMEKGIWE